MTWTILLPHRARSDSLLDVVEAARELPAGEVRDVSRQLVLGALIDGTATSAGELLDKIEKAAPAERRKMLDDARVKAGFPTTATVEGQQAAEMASTAGRIRSGAETRPLRLGYSPGGAIIDLNEADDDAARIQAQEESRRNLREDEDAVRAIEAEALRANERARDAAFRSELPPRFPG
jgi:hypothetical protein